MIQATFQHKRYLLFLQSINKEAHAESIRNLLNFQAKGSERLIKRNVKKKFVLRTNFTINSIKQDRQPIGNNTKKMFSRVVTTSPYLHKQEDGTTENRKAIPTMFTRNSNFKKTVRRMYRQDKLGDFGAKYYATGGKGFFLGKPKGSNRSYGIWMRHNNNKRLTKIKNVSRQDIKIKPTKFFESAIFVFSKQRNIEKAFSIDAQKRLKETAKKFYTSN